MTSRRITIEANSSKIMAVILFSFCQFITGCVNTEVFIQQMKDKSLDRSVRVDAIRIVADRESLQAVDPLIVILKDNGEDIIIRSEAMSALGVIKSSRAVGPLVDALSHEEPEIRRGAQYALGGIGLPAVNPLILALRDKKADSSLILSVEYALEKIGEPAIEPLIPILKDEDLDVRQRVARVLSKSARKNKTGIAANALIPAVKNYNLEIVAAAHEFFVYGIEHDEFNAGLEKEIIAVLIRALEKHGDKDMANRMLNSKKTSLSAAGADWGTSHGYRIELRHLQ